MADQTTTIPKGWKTTTLGGVISSGLVSIHNNKRYPLAGGERLKRQGVYPYYGAASAIDFIDDYKYDGFYLLVAEDGTVYDGKSPMLQLVNGKFWVSNHSHVLQGKDEIITRFLSYILKNVSVSPYITGAVQPKLTKENLYSISFLIPEDENEQHAIATVLSSLDDKIELLREQNKTLEATAQTIFKEWFVNFNFPGATGKMVDSELGQIPEGWRVGKITELGGVITDYVANGSFASLKENVTLYDTENFALFLRNTDLKSGFAQKVYVDERSYNFLKKTQMFGGEIIISNVGDVGSVYLCPFFKMPMVLGNNTISLKSNYQSYLFTLFTNRIGQFLIESITGGSAQPKFNKTDFRSIRLIIPSTEVLNSFENTAWPLYKKMLDSDLQIQTLSTLRDTILPKLMKGEVRVEGFKD